VGVDATMINTIITRVRSIPGVTLYENEEQVLQDAMTGLTDVAIVLEVEEYNSVPSTTEITDHFHRYDVTLVFTLHCFGDAQDGEYLARCEMMRNLVRLNMDLSKLFGTSKIMPTRTAYEWLNTDSVAKTSISFECKIYEKWSIQ
jgi:hypothetical protein